MSRRRWLVIILVAAAGLAAAMRLTGGDAAPSVTPERTDKKTGKRAKPLTADDVPVVATLLGKGATGETFTRERNLFSYAKSPEALHAEEAERQRLAAEAAARAKADAERAAEAAKAAAEQQALARKAEAERLEIERQNAILHPKPPVPPSFPYQYVGTIGPADDPYAILLGVDRQFRYAKAGDVVDRKFKVEYVGAVRLDLSYTEPQFADQFAQVSKYDASTAPAAPAAARGR